MSLYPPYQTYIPGEIVLKGSFVPNGVSTPTGLRDGNSNAIDTVAYVSPGLFTVTFADWMRAHLPEQLVTAKAFIMPVDSTPVLVCTCEVIDGSWSLATRSFQILVTKVADVGAAAYFDPAPSNPDAGSRVCFELCGSNLIVGKD